MTPNPPLYHSQYALATLFNESPCYWAYTLYTVGYWVYTPTNLAYTAYTVMLQGVYSKIAGVYGVYGKIAGVYMVSHCPTYCPTLECWLNFIEMIQ